MSQKLFRFDFSSICFPKKNFRNSTEAKQVSRKVLSEQVLCSGAVVNPQHSNFWDILRGTCYTPPLFEISCKRHKRSVEVF